MVTKIFDREMLSFLRKFLKNYSDLKPSDQAVNRANSFQKHNEGQATSDQ